MRLYSSRIKNCHFGTDYTHYCTQGNLYQCYQHYFPKICIVIEQPSEGMQDASDIFAGHTGRYLLEVLNKTGINLIDVKIMFAVGCIAADVKEFNSNQIKTAHKLINEEIYQLKPELVIVLGAFPARVVLGKQQNLKSLRQRFFDIAGSKVGFSFSLKSIFAEPAMLLTIIRDVEFLIRNYKGVEKQEVDYRVNPDDVQWSSFEDNIPIAFDLETTGLNPFKENQEILTAAVSSAPYFSIGLQLRHPDNYDAKIEQRNAYFIRDTILQNETITLVGHNIKFDCVWWLSKYGGQLNCKLFDTKIAYSIIDENAPDNSLKYLASSLTDMGHYEDDIDVKNLINTPFDKVIFYNMQDADASIRLYYILYSELEKRGLLKLMEFMMDVLKTLVHMELNGVYIDKEWALEKGREVWKEFSEAQDKCKSMYSNLDLNSPKQLAQVLFEDLRLPILERTEKTGLPVTDKKNIKNLLELPNLTDIQKNFLTALQAYKNQLKIWNTYFQPLPEYIKYDGRIHTSYNMTPSRDARNSSGTVTGRLSSSNPNLQNIPRSNTVRGMFAASPGYRELDADYSQLELRVAAFYAQEKALIEAFENDLDPHTAVLSELVGMSYDDCEKIRKDSSHKLYHHINEQRVIAKTLNFGILYGAGPFTIAAQCREVKVYISEDQAKEMINKWFTKFPKIKKWIYKTQGTIETKGEIGSISGRTRHLLGARRGSAVGQALIRQGINFPIQTTASEFCLAALMLLEDTFRYSNIDARLVMTIHDSIMLEFKENYFDEEIINLVKLTMEKSVICYFEDQFNVKFNVPLKVDIHTGARWEK